MNRFPFLLLALLVGNLGGLLWAFVGLVLVLCIVFFIMRQAGAPAVAYTVLYVIVGVIALLVVIDLFFGGGTLAIHST